MSSPYHFKNTLFISSLNIMMALLSLTVIDRYCYLNETLEESTPSTLTRSCTLQHKQVAAARQQFCALRSATPPSTGAKPRIFRSGQEKATINCNRPYDDVKTLPLHLSHPVFGSFMDDSESFKPSLEHKKFLNDFLGTTSKIHDSTKNRQPAILDLD